MTTKRATKFMSYDISSSSSVTAATLEAFMPPFLAAHSRGLLERHLLAIVTSPLLPRCRRRQRLLLRRDEVVEIGRPAVALLPFAS
ncbi:unnamed protein product [Lactuca virosa]|uniref:Uncharacterized protein n=1 Tax=Lactuca virosa TaxID=75947 RepID=A0AAU9LF81_9ASTR|nr:unnamed protein product [Lactuca virosa]